jgi:hypothetical protein
VDRPAAALVGDRSGVAHRRQRPLASVAFDGGFDMPESRAPRASSMVTHPVTAV